MLVVECQQHIGEKTEGQYHGFYRRVAAGHGRSSDRLPIIMPVGEQISGRLMIVTVLPLDGLGTLAKTGGYPIHASHRNIGSLYRQGGALPPVSGH